MTLTPSTQQTRDYSVLLYTAAVQILTKAGFWTIYIDRKILGDTGIKTIILPVADGFISYTMKILSMDLTNLRKH